MNPLLRPAARLRAAAMLPCAGAALLCAACTIQVEPLPLPSVHALETAVDDSERASGFLGVDVALNESEDLMSLDLQPGVRVVAVDGGGPAEAAGLRVGDVLLKFDASRVDDPQRLVALLGEVDSARSVRLEVQRGTKVLEMQAEVTVRVAREARLLYHVDRALLRVAVRDGAGGMPEIVELAPGSPLLGEDVAPGDRILGFQGQDPGSSAEFLRRVRATLAPGAPFTLDIETPAGRRRVVEAEAWSPGRKLTAVGIWPLFRWERGLVEDTRRFWFLDLILVYGYSRRAEAGESKTSILGLISWESGAPRLEEVAP